MNEGVRQRPSHGDRLVLAGVVDDDHQIDDLLGHDLVVGPPESCSGVVGRHHHDDFFVAKHGFLACELSMVSEKE